MPAQPAEVSGALLFLNAQDGQKALKTASNFVQDKIATEAVISAEEINHLLDTLAGADMLIDNLKNKQPVLRSMFDVALVSSEKLKTVA